MALRGEIKNAETLGRMLQQGRLLRGLSQRQLADEPGISQRYVWEMESGNATIFTARLFQVMRATGMHLHVEIVEIDEEKTDRG